MAAQFLDGTLQDIILRPSSSSRTSRPSRSNQKQWCVDVDRFFACIQLISIQFFNVPEAHFASAFWAPFFWGFVRFSVPGTNWCSHILPRACVNLADWAVGWRTERSKASLGLGTKRSKSFFWRKTEGAHRLPQQFLNSFLFYTQQGIISHFTCILLCEISFGGLIIYSFGAINYQFIVSLHFQLFSQCPWHFGTF